MTAEEHKERHKQLHSALDELIADWIAHTCKRPSKATVKELMQWAYEQTLKPSKDEWTETR